MSSVVIKWYFSFLSFFVCFVFPNKNSVEINVASALGKVTGTHTLGQWQQVIVHA